VRLVKSLLLALLAGGVVALACSGSGSSSCSSKSRCVNDPPPTDSEVRQCESLANDGKCGALFRTYLACAFTQEKCTAAGVVDEAATRTAILANCATQVNAYQSCTSAAPRCGQAGQACCADATPCLGGCCDPGTQTCVLALAACSGAGQHCSLGTCVVCGAPGQPCCGSLCVDGACCTSNTLTPPGTCVAPGAMCPIEGDAGGGGAACMANGVCQSCGARDANCCPGDVCLAPNTQCNVGYCTICGVRNAVCCAGDVCNDGTRCQQPFGCM
jgi:hypothetical protein